MIQARRAVGPYGGVPRTGNRSDMGWSEHLSNLRGVCEEYQSSAIGVASLCAAMRRERGLDTVLQPSLVEMWDANRSFREEVLGLLNGLAGVIEDTTADVDGGG